MSRKVYCKGCANLLASPTNGPPLCVATSEFVGGPLRKRIDITGTTQAEKRNADNDCPYFTRFSFRAIPRKRWILWRLSYGESGQFREGRLEDYPVDAEYTRKQSRRKEKQERQERFNKKEDDYSEFEPEFEIGEDARIIGGAGDNDERDTGDTILGEDVSDT